jgi:ribosome-associated protein
MGASGPLHVRPGLVLPGDELEVGYTRSGGPGGQNVNKLETCVLLRFSVDASRVLRPEQKERLHRVLGARLAEGGTLLVRAQRFRERHRNEEDARERLAELLDKALTVPKSRKASRPSRGSVQRRLDSKRRRSSTKRARRGEDE